MSAFAGIFARADHSLALRDLPAMLATLAYRGMDSEGLWQDNTIALGHRLHCITPESIQERQPLCHPHLPLVLTGDIRLDNRAELCAAFGLPHAAALPDCDLVLRAYVKWGESSPERLQGDFAFAIWDGRQQTLFCARDRFGVSPFYYHLTSAKMIFATEIRALLALPQTPRRINEERLADIFVLGEQKTKTCWQELLRLPPAHCLTITRDAARLRCYWALDPERTLPPAPDSVYAEEFHALFTEAVRVRLRSAFPLGAQLSGGLDSSAIVTIARHLRSAEAVPLPTFSLVFGDRPYDESDYINAVLDGGGLEPNHLFGDNLPPLNGLAALLDGAEPFFGPNFFFQDVTFQAAQLQGIRVMLDGFDGDTTISHGIAHLGVLARKGRWLALRRELLGLARRFGTSPQSILNQQVLRPLLPPALTRSWDRFRGRPEVPVWGEIFAIDFVERAGLREKIAEYHAKDRTTRQTARRDHARRLSSGLISGVLELHDRQGAAYGLETRSPFLDARLVEFCLALPPEQKIREGWTRVILRNGLPELPEAVRQRGDKANFSPLIARTLRGHHEDQMEDMLRRAPDTLSPYLDISALRRVYARYQETGHSRDALTLWKAVALDLWLGQFRTAAAPTD